MQKLQCAVSNSVSHFIVSLIYTNCFHVCAHAFDKHNPWQFHGLCRLTGRCASSLSARLSIENAACTSNASCVKTPLWHMKSWPGSGTRPVTRTIWMKRVKNIVLCRTRMRVGRRFCDCERVFSGAGYVIQVRRSQHKPSTVDDVFFLHSNLKHHAKHHIV